MDRVVTRGGGPPRPRPVTPPGVGHFYLSGQGRLYCLNETGMTFVMDAKSENYDVLATNDLGEESLGNRLVTSGAEIVTLEIAPAHMYANRNVRRTIGDGVVDALDVEFD